MTAIYLQHDVPAGWIGSNKENLNQTSLTIRMQRKKLYNNILVFERNPRNFPHSYAKKLIQTERIKYQRDFISIL